MCNLYQMTPKNDLQTFIRQQVEDFDLPDFDATRPVGPFGTGLLLRLVSNRMTGSLGQWGMIRPGQFGRIDYVQSKVTPGKRPPAPRPRSTNNARIEGIETKPTFAHAWNVGQRCLVPAVWYAEPNWETGRNIWWHIKRADSAPWFLAGLWSEWTDPETGEVVPNFAVITRNCTGHPFLGRLHKPELDPKTKRPIPPEKEDKRSLVHINPVNWTKWLTGSQDEARQLLILQPSDVFDQRDAQATDVALSNSVQRGLF